MESFVDKETVEDYLMKLGDVAKDFPFERNLAVFSVDNYMFALVEENKLPINLSLRCDPKLSKVLCNKYEEVMPGRNLDKNHWITMVLSGQLNWEEVQDLIRHAYQLVTEDS